MRQKIDHADTFCQRGARNSFTVDPICAYVTGESHNTGLNHHGKNAAMNEIH